MTAMPFRILHDTGKCEEMLSIVGFSISVVRASWPRCTRSLAKWTLFETLSESIVQALPSRAAIWAYPLTVGAHLSANGAGVHVGRCLTVRKMRVRVWTTHWSTHTTRCVCK